jgi:hypothetical protein
MERIAGMTRVYACACWPTNAHLIAAVAQLRYLRSTDRVLDPTFGEGGWWKEWRPETDLLVAFNRAIDGSDFRGLPLRSASFDAIAFDPPYVCPGGRRTSTIQAMHERYGMNDGGFTDPDFRTPTQLQRIIDAGLTEMARLVKPGRRTMSYTGRPNGIILVKCMSYIWGGRLHEGEYLTRKHAESLGLICEDVFTHLSGEGPQPTVNRDGSPRPQRHARRTHSTLYVFRKVA